ncbi:MAG TPA: UDP-N-acetylglucosamine--N-acetylmuramyl-(pentapeptide) pyrophosphoryl-undecaprenol N-acetylglucosamine transferase [Chloroflexota bacterium]|nr:UDP-N-acetylglucosamine--N-acetylmuramyl-(pentapeptide) pyrophosphoryl-undecaprenol N-acetylglucosamine transferase [Chloroflexota bacterium]
MYPAIAVLDSLRMQAGVEVEAVHIGTSSPIERHILSQRNITSTALNVTGLRGRGPLELASGAAKMAAATLAAWRLLRACPPDVAFTAGGYASVPVILAARGQRRPTLLFSADADPGLAIRLEAHLAQRIAVPVPRAVMGLPASKCLVAGYPVRAELLAPPDREQAKRQLGFDSARPLLVVFGGSQGARALNQALATMLDDLLPQAQVLHVCGAADAPEYTPKASASYHVHAFMDNLPLGLAAADLALCRAGASALGELPAVGLPAVLVPGAFAGGHQRSNAAVLAEAGAAVTVSPAHASAGELGPLVLDLLHDQPRRAAMARAMRSLARPHAAQDIAQELLRLAA